MIFNKLSLFLLIFLSLLIHKPAFSQPLKDSVNVLIVIAHPDDETTFAGTVYKITKELHGIADLAVITNGEAGFKYSTLAEAYYGLNLTDEKTGREFLPRIRKKELMNAGGVIGIRDFYFLDQKDAHYGLNEKEPLDTTWDVPFVQRRLAQILTKTAYDYVFCLLPQPETHAGHKAATILALRAVNSLPPAKRPVILAVSIADKGDSTQHFHQYANYPETAMLRDTASFHFDRSVPFGFKGQLNYKIIVNWEIAEHKSQGTMQTSMNKGDYEEFWFFKLNDPARYEQCRQLFEKLKYIPYPVKTYN